METGRFRGGDGWFRDRGWRWVGLGVGLGGFRDQEGGDG